MRRTAAILLTLLVPLSLHAAETVWIEAEHLDGIRGYCWPMGKPEMQKTNGHWGLSGPGWAAEFNQGGESGFLSIACGPDDDKAEASTTRELPEAGTWFLWVRYADWRETTERFEVEITQPGEKPFVARFGEKAIAEEDSEMKLYWGWAFAWDRREVPLKKGPATITLRSRHKEKVARQVDVLVLTTDQGYRPFAKERPAHPAWDAMELWRTGGKDTTTALTRRTPTTEVPASWKPLTFREKGFLYLWNMGKDVEKSWLSDKADRVPVPYTVGDAETKAAFEKKYAGKTDVPIFGDPRLVPVFHGVGPSIFAADPKTGELTDGGKRFAAWLKANPERAWGSMMNYAGDTPIGAKGLETFLSFRDRYVGSIAGESLGYFNVPNDKMLAATKGVTTRRQLAEAFTPLVLEANAAKYRAVYGKDLDKNTFADVIPCLSVGNIAWAPLQSQWGVRTLGYESASIPASVLGMRWAFMRGLARQGGHQTATYRSCNFGDSATIFSNQGSYHTPQAILDNYYSVYSGAGMTWYKQDLWYQYMAGSSMFYHEQGFDEFWRPGGTAAAGVQDVQLSPKGKLVDRFLRVTRDHPDRGTPFTPMAFLVDYAHGWEPSPYWPNSFKNFHNQPDRFRFGIHETMLQEYFWLAFHPIGPESGKPLTATNETFLPAPSGDVYDVIAAYPDVKRWTTIDTYPVCIVAGEIELTAAEGVRLREYVEKGGTLLIADAHLTGPGLAELKLPKMGETKEAISSDLGPAPRFRYRPLDATGGNIIAKAGDDPFCVSYDRGQGRLIVLSVPHGLTITRQAHPVLAHLLRSLRQGLVPIEVKGDVEWLLNKTSSGWVLTLLNPAGQLKPQQGILPTDHRQDRTVTLRVPANIKTATDWLAPEDTFTVQDGKVTFPVRAGAVRVLELR
jgi:hypothetical protein